ncbi:3-dehydrosphinganine reductase [Saitozyma podzolica]|uniref:3-dehydrosphinganine reductase n=1 Tax=Saitozyma podzolica TaxID=1890683 RepID=A0A427YFX8_9TREE|nr:3-dehydrosphinganine reductase [Saitozyma podzolica]
MCSPPVNPLHLEGKHVYVTGGGGGLGLALMRLVVPLGPNVSFVTKDLVKAKGVVEELESLRMRTDQTIVAVSADLSDYEEARRAIQQAVEHQNGQAPDLTIIKPTPGPGVDSEKAMDGYYYVQAWTAQLCSQSLVKDKKPGTIVFISNLLSTISYAGYSPVAPARYAVKGLYDTLSSELEPHGIKVLLFQVSGQFGGGFDVEQNAKPEITRHLDRENGYVRLDEAVEAPKILNGIARGLDGRI